MDTDEDCEPFWLISEGEIETRVLKNRDISEEYLDGAISREEYYRLGRQEKGSYGALMKKQDVARESGREVFKDGRCGGRTSREVRKSESLACRSTI